MTEKHIEALEYIRDNQPVTWTPEDIGIAAELIEANLVIVEKTAGYTNPTSQHHRKARLGPDGRKKIKEWKKELSESTWRGVAFSFFKQARYPIAFVAGAIFSPLFEFIGTKIVNIVSGGG